MKKATTPKSSSRKSQRNNNMIPSKHELCLLDLLDAGTAGISKLTPSRSNDTCLNTTISELGLDRDIRIERETRPHIHQHGGKTHFAWYWLPSKDEALKACQVVCRLRRERGAQPLSDADITRLVDSFPETPKFGAVA